METYKTLLLFMISVSLYNVTLQTRWVCTCRTIKQTQQMPPTMTMMTAIVIPELRPFSWYSSLLLSRLMSCTFRSLKNETYTVFKSRYFSKSVTAITFEYFAMLAYVSFNLPFGRIWTVILSLFLETLKILLSALHQSFLYHRLHTDRLLQFWSLSRQLFQQNQF